MALKLMIKKTSEVKTPSYSHEGDAGLDLYSAEDYQLKPMEKRVISTGLQVAIPKGYAGLIWDKSGLAANSAVHNLAGVIDSGYRGEVKVVMFNLGKDTFHIKKGMRIAQMLVHPVPELEVVETSQLEGTARNENGFGSTGLL